jgi:hypothetical protein
MGYEVLVGVSPARSRHGDLVHEKVAAPGLTYRRLADGKIVEDDPFTRPDLAQLLGMAPPAA